MRVQFEPAIAFATMRHGDAAVSGMFCGNARALRLDQIASLEFVAQFGDADEKIALQTGVDRTVHIGLGVVDEQRFRSRHPVRRPRLGL